MLSDVLILIVIGLLLSSCTLSRIKTNEKQPPGVVTPGASTARPLSPEEVQTALHLEREISILGFEEIPFDSCQIASPHVDKSCGPRIFTLLHLQVLCRNSQGTVTEISKADLTPIVNSRFSWELGRVRGISESDEFGYVQVRSISQKAAKSERLKLSLGENFLLLRAKEAQKIVVPHDWCASDSEN